ncbi:hypothetical protein [Aneurinibacillus thermoaerophilus]|uniref:hypothetical protein n=1 Tax=Aneurinibacillus thermoaerophilus TaxID=143495 RepID=UPI002E1B8A54|nr:hypothetical protein [Aneurinibacillus thermoaerophilus]MED0738913.1 hypothetical protein [Aneurinibacillus thermoaerophilus]MED0766214.1 hypothetical protein [Aneurinibacillus thermoaerophilus]
MSDKLDLILQKLTQMDSRISAIETGQRELREIMHNIRDRQDETDAKLDALTSEMHERFDKTDRTLRFLESDFDVMYKKVSEHEREISRLKRLGQ